MIVCPDDRACVSSYLLLRWIHEHFDSHNVKGGSGKTASAAYLTHAGAAAGQKVLVVDSDLQGSAMRWSETGDWGITTISLPVKNLHTKLSGVIPAATDLVIIDTPPLDDHSGIVYSALRAADIIVVTMVPTMMEYERLHDVWLAIEEVELLRAAPAQVSVLLNRTVARATATQTFRDLIVADGHRVMDATIPRRESIAQACGAPITDLGPYEAAAAGIMTPGETK